MKIMTPAQVLEHVEGATIVSSYIEDESGLHLVFNNGQCLVIAGDFAIALVKTGNARLH